MSLKLASSGGGSVDLTAPSTASNLIVTLPSATGTLVDTASTQTLTNKTLTAPVISGVTDGSNASAGQVGEYLSQTRLLASATALTTGVGLDVTTALTLTAGDWDVSGFVGFVPATTTTYTSLRGSISLVSGTVDTDNGFALSTSSQTPNTNPIALTVPTRRISVTGTTTVYLVAFATFATSTLTTFGRIQARRVR